VIQNQVNTRSINQTINYGGERVYDQIRFRLGLRARPCWGSLQHSPRPPSWIWGGLLLRGERGLPRGPRVSSYATGSRIIFDAPPTDFWCTRNCWCRKISKTSKTACGSPYTIFTVSANYFFKLTSDAPSKVKYKNWHVFSMLTVVLIKHSNKIHSRITQWRSQEFATGGV